MIFQRIACKRWMEEIKAEGSDMKNTNNIVETFVLFYVLSIVSKSDRFTCIDILSNTSHCSSFLDKNIFIYDKKNSPVVFTWYLGRNECINRNVANCNQTTMNIDY